ncbi:hypothetical protein [Arthrospira platensis]|uniref:hypothetical protein n=1 Tax=Limnospira platensis TaxID=118562 RepID=UPI001689FE8D|nr:hypothetical protein [Arthrospira platensis FACHB-835]
MQNSNTNDSIQRPWREMLFGRRLGRCDTCTPYTLSLFAVADNIVADHPRIRDRSVCLLVAIHPLPASEEGEFRNILLK